MFSIKDFPKISIVIATYNEESMIKDKLRNILEIDYPEEKLEIIVIDSGSTDRTVDIVKSFEENLSFKPLQGLRGRGAEPHIKKALPKKQDTGKGFIELKLIREKERKGKAEALINAFGQLDADTDIVVISDADSRLDKDILNKALKYLEREDVGAICGRQILLNPSASRDAKAERSYRDFYTRIRMLESKIDSNPIMHGEFMAMKRAVMEPPSPDSVADDTEMALKIRRKGYRTLYAPDCIFYEAAPTSLKGRTEQKKRRGQGLIQVFWRNRDMFLNPRYGKFGLIVFPFEFSLYILSPILFFSILLFIGIIGIVYQPLILLFFVALALSVKFSSVVYSFITSEYALLKGEIGLFVHGPSRSWRQIRETREAVKDYEKKK
jgi:cellulose synthase/poly-beta-1,6-N-acetylglucosamine synthase-like glycosyltransferase